MSDSYRLRLEILRVCGLLDTLVDITQKLVDTFSHRLAGNSSTLKTGVYEDKTRDILAGAELVKIIASKSRETLCSSEVSYTSLYNSYLLFDEAYVKVFTSPLPGYIRQLYYEILRNLKTLVNPRPDSPRLVMLSP